MRTRVLQAVAFLFAVIVSGIACFLTTHPQIKTEMHGPNGPETIDAFNSCALRESWPVELKPGEHLVLEHRSCPKSFHLQEDDDSDSATSFWDGHEALLLERRSWGRVTILDAMFSDLKFRTVERGLTSEGVDAILWAYDIKCGSCHGGPEGVLAWNPKTNKYDWNENWRNSDSVTSAIARVLPEDEYLDEANALTWSYKHNSLDLKLAISKDRDAHCCPSGGELQGSLFMQKGQLSVSELSVKPPDREAK